MPDDDTVEFSESDREQLHKMLSGEPVFVDRDRLLATVARIAVEDAELLRRIDG